MQVDPVAYAPYSDPDDFIREVTDHIWVQRDISFIVDNYEPDSIVHGGLGTTVGRDGVIAGSLMRIAESPMHVGQAEDVVWEARGDDAFLSSHLVFASDPHLVDGREVRVRSRTIANCLYRRGRMVEEWVVRDTLALAQQLGIDPDDAAQAIPFQGFRGSWSADPPADVLAVGDSGPRPDEFRAEAELVLEMIREVWSERRLNRVHDYFVRDLFLHDVGDVTVLRPDGYQRSVLDLVAPFPGATFAVRDVQTNYAQRYAGLRVAVLWQMKGQYNGAPRYGAITGAPVDLMGVSQFLVQGGKIVREVRVYDEIALRAQISAGRDEAAAVVIPNIY